MVAGLKAVSKLMGHAPDGKVLKRDIIVAKNYMNEKELSRLNRLVTMFIDYTELMAEDEILMMPLSKKQRKSIKFPGCNKIKNIFLSLTEK